MRSKIMTDEQKLLVPPGTDCDPVRWLVAADYCEERGRTEEAAGWRDMVALTKKLCLAFGGLTGGINVGRTVRFGLRGGGQIRLDRGPRAVWMFASYDATPVSPEMIGTDATAGSRRK